MNIREREKIVPIIGKLERLTYLLSKVNYSDSGTRGDELNDALRAAVTAKSELKILLMKSVGANLDNAKLLIRGANDE